MRVCLVVCFCLFFLSQNEGFSASNQTEVVQLPPGYYIVVGAYRPHQENYALWFSTEINKKGLHAKYGLDAGRKYIYVYLDYYEGYEESIKEMLRVRREGGFDEAWVRIMKDPVNSDQEKAEEKVLNAPIKKSEPVAENEVEVKKIEESKSETVEAVASPDSISSGIVEVIIEEGKITEPEKKIEAPAYSNTSVFFSLLHAQRQEEIEGDVEVIDTDRQRSIEFLKGNLDVTLPDPKSKSGKISLICDLFGYRKIQHDINYIDPMSDTIHDYFDYHEGKFIVHFDMVRLHKGDIATLYNVYFYNDAAVMLPESQYQLTSLLGMLNENPKYKIKLHGHTNGNASGKIIRMGESQNFFALTEDVKEGYGSAKQLSEARAEIIKAYLVANNIKEDRIEIKAWGGARMIHDKNSPNARKNVRVDVEVIED